MKKLDKLSDTDGACYADDADDVCDTDKSEKSEKSGKSVKSVKAGSGDMITFVVFNCASFQIVPTTLIALRAAAGSANAFEILPLVWLCSLATTAFAVIITKVLLKITQRKPTPAHIIDNIDAGENREG